MIHRVVSSQIVIIGLFHLAQVDRIVYFGTQNNTEKAASPEVTRISEGILDGYNKPKLCLFFCTQSLSCQKAD
jgi:hypothetical protein